MNLTVARIFQAVAGLLLLIGFVVNLLPEPAPTVLTSRTDWQISGKAGVVSLDRFPAQFLRVDQAVVAAGQGVIFRSWTPEAGVQPIEVTSPPFRVPEAFAVAVTGSTRTASGKNKAYLSCSSHAQTHPIFLGDANVAVVESVVRLPSNWCPGEGRLHLVAADMNANVGIGTAFTVSKVGLLKRSMLGQAPHVAVALALLIAVSTLGAVLARRVGLRGMELPAGFAATGLVALVVFYGHAALPSAKGWIVPLVVGAFAAALLAAAGRRATLRTAVRFGPYMKAWAIAAFAYSALLYVGGNGLAHWEPNYRFWPATRSSDNELPWLFAEALRHQWDLGGLFGGGWKPTDRPPLMTGFHLLVSDFSFALQAGNSTHLRGITYNSLAVVFSSSWVPLALWLLVRGLRMRLRDAVAVLILIGLLPFAIFNSIYGWPKGLGAAYGLAATAVALWLARTESRSTMAPGAALFGVTGALSMLAHASNALFLAPLGAWLVVRKLRARPGALATGIAAGVLLLASWSLFKYWTLPSHDPVTRYALVGDYGFANPARSLGAMVVDRYRDLGFSQWLEIKARMLVQPLWPISTAVVPVGLNSDFGATGPASLRAWDFMLLSLGNLPLLVAGLGALWAGRAGPVDLGMSARLDVRLAHLLVLLSLATWLLLALLFLAPLIVIHWPYTALFALGVGGLALVKSRLPRLFAVVTIATVVYTAVVWGMAPLLALNHIDWTAFGAVLVVGVLLARRLLTGAPLRPRRPRRRLSESTRGSAAGRGSSGWRLWRVPSGWLRWLGPDASLEPLPLRVRWQRVAGMGCGALTLALLTYALASAVRPLIDDHSFRQTQTAISVFYMLRGNGWIAYLTPVLGAPWAIPFEAPVYQASVALLAWVLPLETSGRVVSVLYLVGAVYFGFRLLRLLLPPNSVVPWSFALLALAAPLHLFWGRAFLIETCALFFGMAFVFFGVRYFLEGRRMDWLLGLLTGVLCVLAKSTTWPGFAVLLALCMLWEVVRNRRLRVARFAVIGVLGFAVLAAGLAWTAYADSLKVQNGFASHLTSVALQRWNMGTFEQRLGRPLWAWTLPDRILPDALGSLWPLALALLAYVAVIGAGARRGLLVVLVVAYMVPLLLFTPLHLVHNYYQVANAILALMALALGVGTLIDRGYVKVGTALLVVLLGGQLLHFYKVHLPKSFVGNEHDQIVTAARWIKEHSPENSAMLAVGVDWSSIAHFYAERKGLGLPTWLPDTTTLPRLTALDSTLGGLPLGSILDCRSLPGAAEYPPNQQQRVEELIGQFRSTGQVVEHRAGECVAMVIR